MPFTPDKVPILRIYVSAKKFPGQILSLDFKQKIFKNYNLDFEQKIFKNYNLNFEQKIFQNYNLGIKIK
jgi:hypothetical protein